MCQELLEVLQSAGLHDRAELVAPIIKALGDVHQRESAWVEIMGCVEAVHCSTAPCASAILAAVHSCDRLFPDDNHVAREQRLSDLFKMCCDAGSVDEVTLEAFRKHLSAEAYLRLTLQDPHQYAKLDMIPHHWRRRIVPDSNDGVVSSSA